MAVVADGDKWNDERDLATVLALVIIPPYFGTARD